MIGSGPQGWTTSTKNEVLVMISNTNDDL